MSQFKGRECNTCGDKTVLEEMIDELHVTRICKNMECRIYDKKIVFHEVLR